MGDQCQAPSFNLLITASIWGVNQMEGPFLCPSVTLSFKHTNKSLKNWFAWGQQFEFYLPKEKIQKAEIIIVASGCQQLYLSKLKSRTHKNKPMDQYAKINIVWHAVTQQGERLILIIFKLSLSLHVSFTPQFQKNTFDY